MIPLILTGLQKQDQKPIKKTASFIRCKCKTLLIYLFKPDKQMAKNYILQEGVELPKKYCENCQKYLEEVCKNARHCSHAKKKNPVRKKVTKPKQ